MNDSEFGLPASLWTSDAGRAADVGARIETGTVFMSRGNLDPELCWTGCKITGRGGALSGLLRRFAQEGPRALLPSLIATAGAQAMAAEVGGLAYGADLRDEHHAVEALIDRRKRSGSH